ncbi:MAG TPA: NAD(P)-dependent oxidoreductase [Acidimicrobiales bacterium]
MTATESARIGWAGAGGRMGIAMAGRLIDAAFAMRLYNRTRSKLASLEDRSTVVDTLEGLSGCEIVFLTASADADFEELCAAIAALPVPPSVVVDHTTVSVDASARVRAHLEVNGIAFLAAPVSGNPGVVRSGQLSIVVSGPRDALEVARPYLEALANSVTYVGEGEQARLVKICHNLYLAMVVQGLIEITVLGERAGIARADMLGFINQSVMGSVFSGYKEHAFVDLDFTPTFTTKLLAKDVGLGLGVAEELNVSMPVAERVREIVKSGIDQGHGDEDFASLILVQAKAAGVTLNLDGHQVAAVASTEANRG